MFNPNKQPQTKLTDNQENLAGLANKLEPVYKHRPDPRKFVGAMSNTKFAMEYTKEAIEFDIKQAEQYRREFDEDNAQFGEKVLDQKESGFQYGEMLQSIIIDRINNGWIPGVRGIMSADPDDIFSGIDAAMKYQKGGYFGVSFDMTISENEEVIEKKIKNYWEKYVEEGSIPVLKYFEDPEDPEVRGRQLMPKFIIGGSRKDLERLAKAYENGDLSSIDNDPLKYTIMAQIDTQLDMILDFYDAHEGNKRYDFAKSQYLKLYDVFQTLKSKMNFDTAKKEEGVREHMMGNKIYKVSHEIKRKKMEAVLQ